MVLATTVGVATAAQNKGTGTMTYGQSLAPRARVAQGVRGMLGQALFREQPETGRARAGKPRQQAAGEAGPDDEDPGSITHGAARASAAAWTSVKRL